MKKNLDNENQQWIMNDELMLMYFTKQIIFGGSHILVYQNSLSKCYKTEIFQ